MKYSINKTNHSDFQTFSVNRLKPRAYFIAHSKKKFAEKADFMTERYNSDVVEVLSGEWDFKYYKKKSKLNENTDTAKIKFDKVNVPSTWQRTGYEAPAYINCPYTFDPVFLGLPEKQGVKPPEIPEDFSCALYRKFVNVSDINKNFIITFLGVASCLELYVNGNYVGYGEGSHNSYEFDITKYLTEGENEILAVVFRWCNGSYLEAQDMFRENGIFRDVLLHKYEKTYINDFEAIPTKKGNNYNLNFKAEIKGELKNKTVEIVVKDGKNEIAKTTVDALKNTEITLKNLSVKEWTAETPVLYDFYVTLYDGKNEVMSTRIDLGFKEIKIKGDVFYFNGKKIKLKGVNHHDTHEKTGYCMTNEDLLKDVLLMKEFNVNCVRTSHYPPDPLFLILCDRYGLYVVDEADIETHGLWHLGCDIDDISQDLKWAKHYMDRVERMYYRDRNHPSITMWSLGNESGGYKCHDKCYNMLKKIGTDIPVHYEGACRTKRHHYDVFSEMYTHQDDLIKVREGTRGKEYFDVPFYLCEYVHAMGAGPGAMEEYMQIFYSSDKFMGGCVWEWADHAVLHENDGCKYRYTYGGDHGEKLHDGNFCVDGLFYPDRTPHTGAFEMKNCYRPLRVKKYNNNKVTLFNTNYFTASENIEVYYELQENGEVVGAGSFLTCVEPQKDATYTLDLPKPSKDKNVFLNLTYLKGDFEVASEQIKINEAKFVFTQLETGKVSITSENEKLTVKIPNGAVEFSEETGEMVSYKANGVSVLSKTPVSHKGFLLNLSRAYLDNDGFIKESWEEHNLFNPKIVLEDFSAEVKSGIASVSEYFSVYGKEDILYNASIIYIIGANGVIDIEVAIAPDNDSKEKYSEVAVLGLTFEADKNFAEIEYFGRGEKENYNDFNAHAPIGLYKSAVEDEHEPYVFPQDNMNHSDVSYLKLKNGEEQILIYSDNKFNFSTHNYTKQLLQDAKHQEDLYDQKTTFVTLNAFGRGTGTGSCGPQTLPEYSIDLSKEMTFNFVIVPSKGEK